MDLNGDGIKDILSGSYSRKTDTMAGLLHVLYGMKDGTFKKPAVLNGSDGKPLILDPSLLGNDQEMRDIICTRPEAVDWNGDGKLDLVVGNFAGSLYLVLGTGDHQFESQGTLMRTADGKPLQGNGAHSDPHVVDWDGDGDLDLVVSFHNGQVLWAQNAAEKGQPASLKTYEVLIPATNNQNPEAGPCRNARIWVADVNSDGKQDILLGDQFGADKVENLGGHVWLYTQQ